MITTFSDPQIDKTISNLQHKMNERKAEQPLWTEQDVIDFMHDQYRASQNGEDEVILILASMKFVEIMRQKQS